MIGQGTKTQLSKMVLLPMMALSQHAHKSWAPQKDKGASSARRTPRHNNQNGAISPLISFAFF
jgi:hypothetical protein